MYVGIRTIAANLGAGHQGQPLPFCLDAGCTTAVCCKCGLPCRWVKRRKTPWETVALSHHTGAMEPVMLGPTGGFCDTRGFELTRKMTPCKTIWANKRTDNHSRG